MASDDPRAPPGGGIPFPFPFPMSPVVQEVRIAPVGLWSATFGGFFIALGMVWTLDNFGVIDLDAWKLLPVFFVLLGILILATSYARRRAMKRFWESQLPPR